MHSNLAYETFIFYLYSFFFKSPRWRFVLQTETSGKYNFVLFSYFFYNSSSRKDQFTILILIIWYSRFYWSRSTKYPTDPQWFVVVVLPSQWSVSDTNFISLSELGNGPQEFSSRRVILTNIWQSKVGTTFRNIIIAIKTNAAQIHFLAMFSLPSGPLISKSLVSWNKTSPRSYFFLLYHWHPFTTLS